MLPEITLGDFGGLSKRDMELLAERLDGSALLATCAKSAYLLLIKYSTPIENTSLISGMDRPSRASFLVSVIVIILWRAFEQMTPIHAGLIVTRMQSEQTVEPIIVLDAIGYTMCQTRLSPQVHSSVAFAMQQIALPWPTTISRQTFWDTSKKAFNFFWCESRDWFRIINGHDGLLQRSLRSGAPQLALGCSALS